MKNSTYDDHSFFDDNIVFSSRFVHKPYVFYKFHQCAYPLCHVQLSLHETGQLCPGYLFTCLLYFDISVKRGMNVVSALAFIKNATDNFNLLIIISLIILKKNVGNFEQRFRFYSGVWAKIINETQASRNLRLDLLNAKIYDVERSGLT